MKLQGELLFASAARVLVTFLALRIMTAAAFDSPLSLLACLLISIIYGVLAVPVSGFYFHASQRYTSFSEPFASFASKTLRVLLFWLVVFFILSWLVAFGFSERFFQRELEFRELQYNRFLPLIIFALPPFIDWVIFVFSAYQLRESITSTITPGAENSHLPKRPTRLQFVRSMKTEHADTRDAGDLIIILSDDCDIVAVEGQTCTGQVEGRMKRINESIWQFQSKDENEEHGNCTIFISNDQDGTFSVTQSDGCRDYHGYSCCFSGVYLTSDELPLETFLMR